MHPIRIVIKSKIFLLSLEVDLVPEEHAIEIFATNGAHEPFDEGMGNRVSISQY